MKKINVEYGIDGRIFKLSDNAVHYEQENLALHIDATIPTDKKVRGYIKAPNGNSNVTGTLEKKDGVYTLVVEDEFMAKGTLYVGFEAFDDTGCAERFEPLKVYVDGFVSLDGGSTDNVYVVTVEVAEVETLLPDEKVYVENVGTKKDVRLKFGIPQGEKGDDGYTPQKGTDYYTPEEAETFALEVEQKYVESMNNKVDKEVGKGLSSNDFSDNYLKYVQFGMTNLHTLDTELNESSKNPVQNKAIAEAVNKKMDEGRILKDTETKEVYTMALDGSFWGIRDGKAREKISNFPMQKIYEVTTADEINSITISEDMNGNPFKLDEAFVLIRLPEPLTKSADWSCYIYNGSSKPSSKCWFYFTANTTGKNFIAKAERACENLWFTQKFSNLAANATNNTYSSGYLMADVNYIDILTLHCEGIPVGSTVVVCGRKVID